MNATTDGGLLRHLNSSPRAMDLVRRMLEAANELATMVRPEEFEQGFEFPWGYQLFTDTPDCQIPNVSVRKAVFHYENHLNHP